MEISGQVARILRTERNMHGDLTFGFFLEPDEPQAGYAPLISVMAYNAVAEGLSALQAGARVRVVGEKNALSSYDWVDPGDSSPRPTPLIIDATEVLTID